MLIKLLSFKILAKYVSENIQVYFFSSFTLKQ